MGPTLSTDTQRDTDINEVRLVRPLGSATDNWTTRYTSNNGLTILLVLRFCLTVVGWSRLLGATKLDVGLIGSLPSKPGLLLGANYTGEARDESRATKKTHQHTRILQNMISGIPLILGLGARISDPYVYVVFWAPRKRRPQSDSESCLNLVRPGDSYKSAPEGGLLHEMMAAAGWDVLRKPTE